MRNHVIGGLALVLAAASIPTAAQALSTTVNCPGDTISAALDAGFDDITVNGTCNQGLITITRDDVTIAGGPSGATIVGEFYLNGARRVTIRDLTIQTGAPPDFDGIFADNNGNVLLLSVVIEDTARYGVLVDHGASVYLSSVTIHDNFEGVFAARNSYVAADHASIQDAGENGLNINLGSSADVVDSTIQNNGINGVQLALGASATVQRNTIVGNHGSGVVISDSSNGSVVENTITGNDIGVIVVLGSNAAIERNTVKDNTGAGVVVARGSNADLTGNAIEGSPLGVSVDSAAAVLADNQVTNSPSDDGALDMVWGANVWLAGGNTLTAASFAIFANQGTTLIQRRGHDTASGPVFVGALSNAEFRDVSVTGKVDVADHSLLRIRDQSSNSGNVSVRGNISVAQDSGLNFLRSGSDRRVRVVGGITCADTESSVSAPSANVTITGKKIGCTGYNIETD